MGKTILTPELERKRALTAARLRKFRLKKKMCSEAKRLNAFATLETHRAELSILKDCAKKAKKVHLLFIKYDDKIDEIVSNLVSKVIILEYLHYINGSTDIIEILVCGDISELTQVVSHSITTTRRIVNICSYIYCQKKNGLNFGYHHHDDYWRPIAKFVCGPPQCPCHARIMKLVKELAPQDDEEIPDFRTISNHNYVITLLPELESTFCQELEKQFNK